MFIEIIPYYDKLKLLILDRGKFMETYKTGDKPGKGKYKCLTHRCGRQVSLENNNDALPECQKCGKAEFKKI